MTETEICGKGRYKICPYKTEKLGKVTPNLNYEERTVPRHYPKAWVRRQDAAFLLKNENVFFRQPEI